MAQTDQADVPPSFTLQKDITIKAGTQQDITLAVAGITKGYIIKSISVKQNRCYRTKQFKVKELENKPIPPDGLPITLTADSALKAGSYELNIKIGKTGNGSRLTEQWVTSTIHVIKDEIKHNCLSQDETDTAENIQMHAAQPRFTLKDTEITIKAGTQQDIMLETDGTTEGYIIKRISVSVQKILAKKREYYTNEFGIDKLQKPEIPPSGLKLTLTPKLDLKAGDYELNITIGKQGPGSKKTKTEQQITCMLHVINHEAKNEK